MNGQVKAHRCCPQQVGQYPAVSKHLLSTCAIKRSPALGLSAAPRRAAISRNEDFTRRSQCGQERFPTRPPSIPSVNALGQSEIREIGVKSISLKVKDFTEFFVSTIKAMLR